MTSDRSSYHLLRERRSSETLKGRKDSGPGGMHVSSARVQTIHDMHDMSVALSGALTTGIRRDRLILFAIDDEVPIRVSNFLRLPHSHLTEVDPLGLLVVQFDIVRAVSSRPSPLRRTSALVSSLLPQAQGRRSYCVDGPPSSRQCDGMGDGDSEYSRFAQHSSADISCARPGRSTSTGVESVWL